MQAFSSRHLQPYRYPASLLISVCLLSQHNTCPCLALVWPCLVRCRCRLSWCRDSSERPSVISGWSTCGGCERPKQSLPLQAVTLPFCSPRHRVSSSWTVASIQCPSQGPQPLRCQSHCFAAKLPPPPRPWYKQRSPHRLETAVLDELHGKAWMRRIFFLWTSHENNNRVSDSRGSVLRVSLRRELRGLALVLADWGWELGFLKRSTLLVVCWSEKSYD